MKFKSIIDANTKRQCLIHSVAALAIVGLFGCSASPEPGPTNREPSPIIGTWLTTPTGSTHNIELVFGGDYRFLVVDSGATIASGEYVTTGNQVIMQYDLESVTGDCSLAATYRYLIESDSVRFERVHDDICTSRVELFNLVWSRQ